MIVADIAARTLDAPAELPVGVLTALMGAPFFLYLIQSRKSGLNIR
jgi:iron complex transport system permease protein